MPLGQGARKVEKYLLGARIKTPVDAKKDEGKGQGTNKVGTEVWHWFFHVAREKSRIFVSVLPRIVNVPQEITA